MFQKIGVRAAIATVIAVAGLFTACSQTPTGPPFAHKTASGPITADQAKSIAAQALGGTALSVKQEIEDEDGEQVFEVKVQVTSPRFMIKEVEVRISDGAVLEIENADSDD